MATLAEDDYRKLLDTIISVSAQARLRWDFGKPSRRFQFSG
jgi:hypothetical protein